MSKLEKEGKKGVTDGGANLISLFYLLFWGFIAFYCYNWKEGCNPLRLGSGSSESYDDSFDDLGPR